VVVKKKAVKGAGRVIEALTGDAAKRARKRALMKRRGDDRRPAGAAAANEARIEKGRVAEAKWKADQEDKLRQYLKLPPGTPVKGHVVERGAGWQGRVMQKGDPGPVLRGVSAKHLAENHNIAELKKMIKSVKSGRIGKELSTKEKTSQILRLQRAIDSKARTEKDVGQIMKEGQRQWNPKEGMVMKRGGLLGPSYRHGRKDYRKGGLAKRMK